MCKTLSIGRGVDALALGRCILLLPPPKLTRNSIVDKNESAGETGSEERNECEEREDTHGV